MCFLKSPANENDFHFGQSSKHSPIVHVRQRSELIAHKVGKGRLKWATGLIMYVVVLYIPQVICDFEKRKNIKVMILTRMDIRSMLFVHETCLFIPEKSIFNVQEPILLHFSDF